MWSLPDSALVPMDGLKLEGKQCLQRLSVLSSALSS